jgi:hypothetical protein
MPAEVERAYTPNELAKLLRVSPDRIRAWIVAGQLGAVNVAQTRSGKPRFVVLPQHLEAFERCRRVAPQAKRTCRQRRRPEIIDYYPGD